MSDVPDLVQQLRARFVELDEECGRLAEDPERDAEYQEACDRRMAVVMELDQARQAARAARDEAAGS